jgi:sugar/nucleoside kinase (ribokinase family)
MTRVLVVGSMALDDIEAPAGSRKGVLGGAACYFAVAASYFAPVLCVGVVGRDFPPEHLDFLRARGIDLDGVYSAEGPTFRWGGRYHASLNTRDTLYTELGVFEGFEPHLPDAYRDAPWVFLANIQPDLQRQVLGQVRAPRFVAMDTMNLWIETTRESLSRVLREVRGLVINDEEARLLTGEANVVRAARAIRRLGPEVLVVKRGEYGALLFDAEGVFAAPAMPLAEPRDPTGAGDSFAGGFMGALARAGDAGPEALRRAAIYASVMASFTVEDFGLDRLRTLRPEEVEARFEAFRALTRF